MGSIVLFLIVFGVYIGIFGGEVEGAWGILFLLWGGYNVLNLNYILKKANEENRRNRWR